MVRNSISHITLIVLALLAISTSPGLAEKIGLDDLSLKDLTSIGLSNSPKNVTASTAAKVSQTTATSPSMVRVVTAKEIRTFGYRTLDDILRSIPGLYTTSDGLYTYLGVRGFGRPGDYNTRILILIDGVRVNENVFDSALVGREFPLDVDLIKRVEYAPGPGSAVYGNNAFFGVINVITKNGNWYDGFEISGGVGSFDTRKLRLSYGQRFNNGAEILLSATDFKNSDAHLYFSNEYTSIDSDRDKDRHFFGKFSYGSFKTEIVYGYRQTDTLVWPEYSGLVNDYDESHDKKLFINTAYTKKINNNWSADSSFSYNWASYLGVFPYDYYGELIEDAEKYSGSWLSGELRLINTSFEDHRILFGVEGHWDLYVKSVGYEVGSEPFYYQKKKYKRYGIYLQDDITLTDTVILLLGGRYDYTDSGNKINPRLGLIWQPRDETTLKFLYGSAFRTANYYEAGINIDSSSYWDNPDITIPDFETIETYEIALQHHLTPSVKLSGAIYYYQLKDLIEEYNDEYYGFYFKNGETIDALGLELTGEKRFSNGSMIDLSYSLQKTEDFTDERLSNSPVHQLKFRSSTPLWFKNGKLGFEAQYTSDRTTYEGVTLNSYWLTNMTITYQTRSFFDISASIYNIGDTNYSDPVSSNLGATYGVPQQGRSFYLQVGVKF